MNWDKVYEWAGPELVATMESLAVSMGLERDGWKEIPPFKNTLILAAIVKCTNDYCAGSEGWEEADIARTLGILDYSKATPSNWMMKLRAYRRADKIRSDAEDAAIWADIKRKDAEDLDRSDLAPTPKQKSKPRSKGGGLTVQEIERHEPKRRAT